MTFPESTECEICNETPCNLDTAIIVADLLNIRDDLRCRAELIRHSEDIDTEAWKDHFYDTADLISDIVRRLEGKGSRKWVCLDA